MGLNKAYKLLVWCLFYTLMWSCAEDNSYTIVEPDPVSPVVFNLDEVPFQLLSEYNFFEGEMSQLKPVYGVLPYSLNSTLFSDYAKKKRFVWMPSESSASYINDATPLDFPNGAVLIKNFYYNNVLPENDTKILETRLMYKKDDGWRFANYVWNDEQTEATFTTEHAYFEFDWIEQGVTKSVNYKVPRFAECFTCHNNFDTPNPIGPKPQNLNRSYVFDDGTMNQLNKWIEQGYLQDNLPDNISSTVDWKDSSQPIGLRARSYLDINCAHCHSDQSYCDYAHMRFGFSDYENDANLGVCVEHDFYLGDDVTHIVAPGNASGSALFFRVASDLEEFQMPLIGRTLVHEEGLDLLEQWINTLENCN